MLESIHSVNIASPSGEQSTYFTQHLEHELQLSSLYDRNTRWGLTIKDFNLDYDLKELATTVELEIKKGETLYYIQDYFSNNQGRSFVKVAAKSDFILKRDEESLFELKRHAPIRSQTQFKFELGPNAIVKLHLIGINLSFPHPIADFLGLDPNLTLDIRRRHHRGYFNCNFINRMAHVIFAGVAPMASHYQIPSLLQLQLNCMDDKTILRNTFPQTKQGSISGVSRHSAYIPISFDSYNKLVFCLNDNQGNRLKLGGQSQCNIRLQIGPINMNVHHLVFSNKDSVILKGPHNFRTGANITLQSEKTWMMALSCINVKCDFSLFPRSMNKSVGVAIKNYENNTFSDLECIDISGVGTLTELALSLNEALEKCLTNLHAPNTVQVVVSGDEEERQVSFRSTVDITVGFTENLSSFLGSHPDSETDQDYTVTQFQADTIYTYYNINVAMHMPRFLSIHADCLNNTVYRRTNLNTLLRNISIPAEQLNNFKKRQAYYTYEPMHLEWQRLISTDLSNIIITLKNRAGALIQFSNETNVIYIEVFVKPLE